MVTTTTALIAERVENRRIEIGLPLLKLADATGIPRTTLRRKLAGHHDFTIPELQAVSHQLGLKFSDLLRALPKAVA